MKNNSLQFWPGTGNNQTSIPLTTLNALAVTIENKTYEGGWTETQVGQLIRDDDGLSLTEGETITFKIELGAGSTGAFAQGASLAAPVGVKAEAGEGAATVTWQMPETGATSGIPATSSQSAGATAQGAPEPVAGVLTAAATSQSAPASGIASTSEQTSAPAAQPGNGFVSLANPGQSAATGTPTSPANSALIHSPLEGESASQGHQPAGAPVGGTGLAASTASEYEVAWTREGDDWSAGGAVRVTDLTTTIPELDNGTRYRFRVRAWSGAVPGPWSETVATVPGTAATLVESFPDLELANGAVHAIDMRAHFSGTGLTYEVLVTTTNERTGQVKTGPINTVARDKVRGVWSDDVLTLTAGPSGHHVLPLAFDWSRKDEGVRTIDLSEFRERVRSQGFALSLNQPFAPASSADGQTGAQAPPGAPGPEGAVALTFWGQGSATSGVTDTVFWGLDASMGGQWMTGLAFAESGAEVSQSLTRGEASVSGFAESEISAVYPYLRSRFGSGTEVWSLMGWGSGQVDSTWTGVSLGLEETVLLDGDVAFDLGLVGAEQTLFEAKGFSLSALGDTGWSRLAVTSGTAEGIEATVSRTRLALQGRYGSEDGAFSSSLRAGMRVDGGDGQTASGVELMGDVRRTWGRWLAGVEGRWYAADTADAGHGSQGVRASLSLQPRANGTGLGLTVSSGWGTRGEAAKQDGLLASLEDGYAGAVPVLHLDGRVSWGMRLLGQGLYGPGERLSPYAEFSLVEDGTRHLRTGVALEGSVGMGLALERRENPSNTAEHGLMLRLDTRF